MQVADPLGFFEPEDKNPQAQSPQRKCDSASSNASCDDESEEGRIRKLRQKIDVFVQKNKLDHRVSGIMQNMHPSDAAKVMEVPFPDDCRNPSGFVVSQIRRTERDAGRPKDYRWNGRSWDKGPTVTGTRERDRNHTHGRNRDNRHSGRSCRHALRDHTRSRRHCRSRSQRRKRHLDGDSRSDSRSASYSDSKSGSCSPSYSKSRRRRRRRS